MRKTTCLLIAAVILAAADQGRAMPPLLSYDRWVITPHGFPDVDSPLIQAWENNKNLPPDTVEISSAYVMRAEDFWKEKPSGKLPNEDEVPTRFHYVSVRVVQRHHRKLEFLGWLWMMTDVVDMLHGKDVSSLLPDMPKQTPTEEQAPWVYAKCEWVVNPDLPRDTVQMSKCNSAGMSMLLKEKPTGKDAETVGTSCVRVVQRQPDGKLTFLGWECLSDEEVDLLHGKGAAASWAGKAVSDQLITEWVVRAADEILKSNPK
jgi:hypothetical protein